MWLYFQGYSSQNVNIQKIGKVKRNIKGQLDNELDLYVNDVVYITEIIDKEFYQ